MSGYPGEASYGNRHEEEEEEVIQVKQKNTYTSNAGFTPGKFTHAAPVQVQHNVVSPAKEKQQSYDLVLDSQSEDNTE